MLGCMTVSTYLRGQGDTKKHEEMSSISSYVNDDTCMYESREEALVEKPQFISVYDNHGKEKGGRI